MIEIPEVWSECEISALSKRTRELVVAVLTEASFSVASVNDNTLKITPQKGSKIDSFRRVIETISATVNEENVKFSVAV